MNTAIKQKALTYRRLILERFLFFYHLHSLTIFWGLRLFLAFLLLLLSLSPSVSGLTQAICLIGLLILGMICFLDNQQQVNLGEDQIISGVTEIATKKPNTAQASKKHKVNKDTFSPLNLRQIVFEVNAFVEKKNINRKTIELFVSPIAYGTRHAIRAIDQLRAAGYAIRLYTDSDLPESMLQHQQNMIGECNGYVQLYLSQ